jgi:hypothetical protein
VNKPGTADTAPTPALRSRGSSPRGAGQHFWGCAVRRARRARGVLVGVASMGGTTSSLRNLPSTCREAYATVLHGHHPNNVCGVTTLGHMLARLDPSRPRVVLVHNVTPALLQLVRANRWTVHHANHSDMKLWKGRALGHHAVKIQLLSLPCERLLYFDADHVPDQTSGAALQRLWKLPQPGAIAAQETVDSRCRARPCFNSGFMMIRPSPKAYEAAQQHAQAYSTMALPLTGMRCSSGFPGDQPLLNEAFPNFTRIPRGIWHVLDWWQLRVCRTVSKAICGAAPPRVQAPQIRSGGTVKRRFAGGASFHFYSHFRPWEHPEQQSQPLPFSGTTMWNFTESEILAGCKLPREILRHWWVVASTLGSSALHMCKPPPSPSLVSGGGGVAAGGLAMLVLLGCWVVLVLGGVCHKDRHATLDLWKIAKAVRSIGRPSMQR